ncbi:DUF742 domain-containing protein [Streptomyces sp. NBC_01237]|uniref:DUF742 domain-containing protein n=1 Tax=Streptomyces sp. NBC_01237 TaxID=2903790 RepID=UPI002DDA7864|nr:DUF742 domain-containing protein [Streptomyces sp. NBC_01237]WRZ77190.1 DUF742 domain-containing protein [Streptomyces sp. NBC_01237]
MSGVGREGGDHLVRAYVITGGRARPSRNHFDLITLVVLAARLNRSGINPEACRILDLLAREAQSVAELSAALDLPVSVLRVLLADLMEAGHITTNGRILDSRADRSLLEAVRAGLQKL